MPGSGPLPAQHHQQPGIPVHQLPGIRRTFQNDKNYHPDLIKNEIMNFYPPVILPIDTLISGGYN
jgi:hypothetical protein